jgi:hypothetical protein
MRPRRSGDYREIRPLPSVGHADSVFIHEPRPALSRRRRFCSKESQNYETVRFGDPRFYGDSGIFVAPRYSMRSCYNVLEGPRSTLWKKN